MKGWNEQMYGKVPASSKVTDFDSPGAIVSVANEPVPVAVWAWLSWLSHVTVPPALTVTSGV